ncbi:hypothetical protein KSP39_PZI004056 [Platanthera zijinensis]|uniref:Uncharacterized protein n=1 Tax=Platanthera zijinensis TaxID=2320716 RepID=A0AAP0GBS1_9ASPA
MLIDVTSGVLHTWVVPGPLYPGLHYPPKLKRKDLAMSRGQSSCCSSHRLVTGSGLALTTGDPHWRSSKMFHSNIDRSWFDMVYALLVPGRVIFSICSTLSGPTFGLVFYSYTINGGLPDICCNVSNSMLLLLLSLNKS